MRGQEGVELQSKNLHPDIQEIIVQLRFANTSLSTDVTSYVSHDTLFVPLIEMFHMYKLNVEVSRNPLQVQGFFIREENRYKISFSDKSMHVEGRSYKLELADFFISPTDLFIRTELLEKLFGLSVQFDELNLSAILSSREPLPLILEYERNQRRASLLRDAEVQPIDHFIPREYHVLSGAMFDWKIGYTKLIGENIPLAYQYSFGLGSEIAGGDLNGFFNGDSRKSIDWNLTPVSWRYVAPESFFFRQVSLGTLSADFGKYIGLRGFKLTNAPPTPRRQFGLTTISEQTGSEWDVELYTNNKLTDFTKSDMEGNYSFRLKLPYGGSTLRIDEFGKQGEERSTTRYIDIPYTYLPSGEFEYSLTAGRLYYLRNQEVAQAKIGIGISQYLTATAGVQYINEPSLNTVNPFVGSYVRIADNVNLSASYFYQQQATGSLYFGNPALFHTELSYARYEKHPIFNSGGLSEEKRFTLYLPLQAILHGTTFQFGIREAASESFQNGTGFATVSTNIFSVFTILTSRFGWTRGNTEPGISSFESRLETQYWFASAMYVRSFFEHDFHRGRFLAGGGSIEGRLFKDSWIGLSANYNAWQKNTMYAVTLRFDLPMSQVYSRAELYKPNVYAIQQNASGALAYDAVNPALLFDNRNLVGKSGLSFAPFRDLDGNALNDANDERDLESSIALTIDGGRKLASAENILRYVDFLPYENYRISVNQSAFRDPLMRSHYQAMLVETDPNQFKRIPIPLIIAGEAVGMVARRSAQGNKGAGGLKVYAINRNTGTKFETYSFADGTFSFYGLPLGTYDGFLDSSQLHQLNLACDPMIRNFSIRATESGDFVSDVNFTLLSLEPSLIAESRDTTTITPQPVISDTTSIEIPTAEMKPPKPPVDTMKVLFEPIHTGMTESFQVDAGPFALDSTVTAFLDKAVETLRRNRALKLKIDGHSDNFGSFQENQLRSQQRATKALQYVLRHGLSRDRIQVQAYGSRRPIAPNTTATGRARNNRIDITIIRIQ